MLILIMNKNTDNATTTTSTTSSTTTTATTSTVANNTPRILPTKMLNRRKLLYAMGKILVATSANGHAY